jgi:RNA polymerase sigma-70 factor (ECF subfamily)
MDFGVKGIDTMDEQKVNYKAFEVLVREHQRRVMAYALSLTHNYDVAQDLVQDAFVTAFKKLYTFDAGRNFGSWVRGILRLRYLEWARAQKEIPVEQDHLDRLDAEHSDWDSSEQDPGDALDALKACLKKLPESMSDIVKRFYLNRESGHAVADTLGLNEATVRKRLQRARLWLKGCITETMPT